MTKYIRIANITIKCNLDFSKLASEVESLGALLYTVCQIILDLAKNAWQLKRTSFLLELAVLTVPGPFVLQSDYYLHQGILTEGKDQYS